MEILKLITKQPEITNEQLKAYYHCNDEQLVEKLLDFLEEEIRTFPFYEKDVSTKYLYYTLLRIDDIYEKILNEGKLKLPFRSRYQEIQNEVYRCTRGNLHHDGETVSRVEVLFLDIFFQRDLEHVKQEIEKQPLLLLGMVQDESLIQTITKAYLSCLNTPVQKEYLYYHEIMKTILNHTSIYPDIQEQILTVYEEELEHVKKMQHPVNLEYRFRKLGSLMSDMKHGKFLAQDQVLYHFLPGEKTYEDEYIFTIDDEKTNLREDAISIREKDGDLYVNLYVVDVPDIFKQQHSLLNQAKEKWYQGEKEIISKKNKRELFSLNANGTEKKVVVYELKFSKEKNYQLTDLKIGRGSVHIQKNYSYDQVSEMLKNKKNEKVKSWKKFYDIMSFYHKENRHKNKYHLVKELSYFLKTGSHYQNDREKGNSYLMISELKILVNFYQSRLCFINQIPLMYRLNDFDVSEEEIEYIKRCCNSLEEPEYIMNLLEMLPLFSYYRTENTGHKGLGLSSYAHCTTPARNYFAYLNQQILVSIILEKHFEEIEPTLCYLKEQEELQKEKEERSRKSREEEREKKKFQLFGLSYRREMKTIEQLLSNGQLSFEEIQKEVLLPKEELEQVLDALESRLHIEKKQGYYKYLLRDGYQVGTYYKTDGTFGLVELENGEHILVPTRFVNGAEDRETVLIKIHYDLKEKLGEVMKHRSNYQEMPATIIEMNGSYYAVLDQQNEEPIYLTKTLHAKVDDKVLVKVNRNRGNVYGEVVKVYGNAYDIKTLIHQILDEYHVPNHFPKEVLQEAEQLPTVVTEKDRKGRIDFRNKMIFTIDDQTAKDLDDAISLDKLDNGNYLLGVHIADVSHYVKEGSAIDQEANQRGTSVYVADLVTPMLPVRLSNEICSLNPLEDRLTYSCLMEIDRFGNVLNYSFGESVICSRKKMTYQDVNKVLEGKQVEGYEEFRKTLKEMQKLSHLLREKRERRGAISFELTKPKFIFDQEGNISGLEFEPRKEAEKLIEDFMLSANECAASYMEEQDHLFQYRVHPKPDLYEIKKVMEKLRKMGYDYFLDLQDGIQPGQIESLLSELKDDENYETIAYMFLRAMTKAYYSTENFNHFGLASTHYSHFTSPIRRYPDLLAHRELKNVQKQKRVESPMKLEKELSKKLQHSSIQEVQAENCERKVDRLIEVGYLEGFIGEDFLAKIMMIEPFGIQIQLENGLRGFIPRKDLKECTYYPESLSYFDEKKNCFLRIGDTISCRLDDVSFNNLNASFSYQKKFGKNLKRKPVKNA